MAISTTNPATGEVVKRFDPILITPFPIGPATAFYNAGLINTGAALVSPVDLSGNDGATVTSTVSRPERVALARARAISEDLP